MKKLINLRYAKTHLSRIIAEVARGQEVIHFPTKYSAGSKAVLCETSPAAAR